MSSKFLLNLLMLFVFSSVVYAGSEQATDKKIEASPLIDDDSFTRVGSIGANEVIEDYPLFKQNYVQYQPKSEDIEKIKSLQGMDLVIFMGLWCHDSQREVPHLLKLIEKADHPFHSVKIVAINPNKDLPKEYREQFRVTKTPTIFMLKNGKIKATIVETPKVSIADDLLVQFEQ